MNKQIIFTSAIGQQVYQYTEGKTYVNSPAEAPKGIVLKRGPRGGYYYDEPISNEPKREEPKFNKATKSELANKTDSFFNTEMSFEDFYNNSNIRANSWKKLETHLGLDESADYSERKIKRTFALIESQGDKISELVKTMKTSFDYSDSFETRDKSTRIAYFLGEMRSGLYRDTDPEIRKKMVSAVRNMMDGDVKETNKALKYMGMKERVTATGLKKQAQTKTIEEIKQSLKTVTYKDINYEISPTYISNSKSFRTEEQLSIEVKKVIDNLPPKAKEIINAGKTKIHFITRPEARMMSGALSSNRSLGYYVPTSKQIFIFPEKSGSKEFNIKIEDLEAEGYDEDLIEVVGKSAWRHTVTHELAHAIALNPIDFEIKQREYNLHMQDYSSLQKSNITEYAKTNEQEDFAETFAFYSSRKDYIDEVIENDSKWIKSMPLLKEKFKWMRDNLW